MGIIPSEQLTLYSSGVKKLDASVFSLLMLFDNDRDDLTTSEEVIDAIEDIEYFLNKIKTSLLPVNGWAVILKRRNSQQFSQDDE